MDAIFFFLRTSKVSGRFQEWKQAGVFLELWKQGLLQYDALEGIDWNWLSMDRAMTKAPLGGGEARAETLPTAENSE